jgi:hypothetical protein
MAPAVDLDDRWRSSSLAGCVPALLHVLPAALEELLHGGHFIANRFAADFDIRQRCALRVAPVGKRLLAKSKDFGGLPGGQERRCLLFDRRVRRYHGQSFL